MSSSPQSLIKAKLNPSNRQTLGFNRVESNQCTENEFLCYVLDVYLKDLVNGIANVLDSLIIEEIVLPPITRSFEELRPDFMKIARTRVGEFNLQRKNEERRIAEKVIQLRACAEWATQVRNTAFLKKVVTPDEPPWPSQRLTGSPAYEPIFEQYSNCRGGSLAAIQRVLYLFRCTYYSQVRPTGEIYKIWCIARLYSTFIIYANMQPPKGENTMFECIQIKRGMLELPKNKALKLQGHLDEDGEHFRVTFWYQPELQTSSGELRIPDIKVEVSIGGDGINRYQKGGKNRLYCFNIEARNYQKQGYRQFIEDVLVVAKNNHLETLEMSDSFIIHTDRQVNYWGKLPFKRILEDKFKLSAKTLFVETSEYFNHKCGDFFYLEA